jgi:coenzyme F420 hydrogenase subunit beta
VDFQKLAGRFLTAEEEDWRLGRHLSCHVGHARDKEIRWDAASGGIVTALLLAGLREELFNGALVTRMKAGSPLEPMPILATTEEEIRSATGSKYCPVVANLRLRDILDGHGRYAVVGLPCHIHGLRLAQVHIPALREKVAVSIALFCGLNMSPLATRVALRRRELPLDEVAELRYRGNGWPGGLQVSFRNGETYAEGLFSYFSTHFSAYQMHRCWLCSDAYGELADLSCGDAWLPEYTDSDAEGTSIVIVRDARGQSVLSSVAAEVLELTPLPPYMAIESQRTAVRWKKDRLRAKASLARLAGWQTPRFEHPLPAPGLREFAGVAAQLVRRYLHRRWHQFKGYDG